MKNPSGSPHVSRTMVLARRSSAKACVHGVRTTKGSPSTQTVVIKRPASAWQSVVAPVVRRPDGKTLENSPGSQGTRRFALPARGCRPQSRQDTTTAIHSLSLSLSTPLSLQNDQTSPRQRIKNGEVHPQRKGKDEIEPAETRILRTELMYVFLFQVICSTSARSLRTSLSRPRPPDFYGLIVRGGHQHLSRGVVVDVADDGAVALEPLHDSPALGCILFRGERIVSGVCGGKFEVPVSARNQTQI